MLYDEFHKFLNHRLTRLSEIHVTLIYSKRTILEAKKLCEPDKKFQGTFRKLNWWAGHDKAGYLVLEIDSPDLHRRHNFWKLRGGTHTFHKYSPHLTLATGVKKEEIDYIMNIYNMNPEGLDLPCAFSEEFSQDLKGW